MIESIQATASDRQEHHINLVEAIKNLDSVQSHLDELYFRINGPEPVNEKALSDAKEARPTLTDVLNGAPDTIRRKTEELHKRIDSISASIF